MGKILLKTFGESFKLELPLELMHFLKKNVKNIFTIFSKKNDRNEYVIYIKRGNYLFGFDYNIRKHNDGTFMIGGEIPKSFIKKDSEYELIEEYYLDYTIYQNDSEFLIVSKFKLDNPIDLPRTNMSILESAASIVDTHLTFFNYNDLKKNDIYYIHSIDDKVVYFTKNKLFEAVIKCQLNGSFITDYLNYSRKISLNKFFNIVYPDYDEKKLQKYIEYRKCLGNYDESLFSIVKGEDILTYYLENSYLMKTGTLGNSCMRYNISSIKDRLMFYTRNENISLIILKAGTSGQILGRALLWTTTEGVKIMDRIYTCDSKLVSFFHKYANDNGFLNVYEIRTSKPEYSRDITSMTPMRWLNHYTENHIIDLNWLPEAVINLPIISKFKIANCERIIQVNSSISLPYIDNFNLVNAITMQASLMPIKDTFVCKLTNEFINDMDDILSDNNSGEIYHTDYVNYVNDEFVIDVDEVELDSEVQLTNEQETETLPF